MNSGGTSTLPYDVIVPMFAGQVRSTDVSTGRTEYVVHFSSIVKGRCIASFIECMKVHRSCHIQRFVRPKTFYEYQGTLPLAALKNHDKPQRGNLLFELGRYLTLYLRLMAHTASVSPEEWHPAALVYVQMSNTLVYVRNHKSYVCLLVLE